MNIIFCAGVVMLLIAGISIAIAWRRNGAATPAISVNNAQGQMEVIVEAVKDTRNDVRFVDPAGTEPIRPPATPDQQGKVQLGLMERMRDTHATQRQFYTELQTVLVEDEAAQRERDAFKAKLAQNLGLARAPTVVPSPVVTPAPAPVPVAPVPAPIVAPVAAAS